MQRFTAWFLVFLLTCAWAQDAEARKRRRRKYSGPPPTHPMLLWSRTLSDKASDREQRRVAAFKLSQYSQPIYQESIIQVLAKCTKDEDVQVKVLCTKALGNAGNQGQAEFVRQTLLDRYKEDSELRNTIVRAFLNRKDDTTAIHNLLLDSAKKSQNSEESLALMNYFEKYGNGSATFVDTLATIFESTDNIKLRRAIARVLGEKGKAQDKAIAILSECSGSKDTPLALNCLGGLQLQGKKDARAWSAVEKSIESDDPDVLLATLDVINVLPPNPNPKISKRLVSLIGSTEDELEEKAILTLEVCGDESEKVVEMLTRVLDDKDEDESVRIAAALVLGKQSANTERAKTVLSKWLKEGQSQSLRTACQLGLNDLNTKRPTPSPTSVPPVATSSSAKSEGAKRVPQSEDAEDEKEDSGDNGKDDEGKADASEAKKTTD